MVRSYPIEAESAWEVALQVALSRDYLRARYRAPISLPPWEFVISFTKSVASQGALSRADHL